MATNKTEKIEIENVNHPGNVTRVDADMYEAMKQAFLKILPKTSPRLTEAEIRESVLAHLPEKLFPEGVKASWWTKTVQLDLEAEGVIVRRGHAVLDALSIWVEGRRSLFQHTEARTCGSPELGR